jgi:hypothetical protein
VQQSRYRVNGIFDHAWMEPYAVGFIVMLISIIARRAEASLDARELGLVQREAWSQITGLQADLVGEAVVRLSSTRNESFACGCRNAVAFVEVVYGAAENVEGSWSERAMSGLDESCSANVKPSLREAATSSWIRFFDSRLTLVPVF